MFPNHELLRIESLDFITQARGSSNDADVFLSYVLNFPHGPAWYPSSSKVLSNKEFPGHFSSFQEIPGLSRKV